MNTLERLTRISAIFALFALVGCNQDKSAEESAATTAEVVAPAAPAPAPELAEEKPFIVQSREAQVSARVVSIDHASRDVVLELENGEERAFTVGDAARNLDQVAVGDLITLTFFENISIEVVDGEGLEAGGATLAAAARAEEGESPAGAMTRTDVEVFMVEAINLEENTFILKNAEGELQEFTAHNPDNLQRSAVGDAVVISVTNAVAIDIIHAQAAE